MSGAWRLSVVAASATSTSPSVALNMAERSLRSLRHFSCTSLGRFAPCASGTQYGRAVAPLPAALFVHLARSLRSLRFGHSIWTWTPHVVCSTRGGNFGAASTIEERLRRAPALGVRLGLGGRSHLERRQLD